MSVSELRRRFLERDERALARAISLVEGGQEEGQELLKALRQEGGRARVVGITGAPGSGKSTLTDGLIGEARGRGRRVAVVAIDPTSPYSGGAILGDRIRMGRWHSDREVFVRSMATRGHLGGLAAAALQVVALLDAYGFDYVFLETVGVGQSEVDVAAVADTTVLVLTPGAGDSVQAFKAGIMEIADVFAINKYDLPGGPTLKKELRAALSLARPKEGDWRPPIVEAVAAEGEGLAALYDKIEAHHEFLAAAGRLEELRRARSRFEVASVLRGELNRLLQAHEDSVVDAVMEGRQSPAEAVRELVRGRVL